MDEARVAHLYQEAQGERWDLPRTAFAEALAISTAKAFAGGVPSPAEHERYLASLHLADLALACACARGHEGAWDYFVAEYRPALYRAADALAANGGAREVADALHADLYGLKERDGQRQSLFRYFHGRSSLATWLRSLVAQRYVDGLRQRKRLVPIPAEESPRALPATLTTPDPDRSRYAAAMTGALGLALAALTPLDRLRLGCYYARGMSLAQIGRLMGGHEATVSRQLLRTRREIRAAVETRLHTDYGFSEPEITECFVSMAADAESIDLTEWLRGGNPRKKKAVVRSIQGDPT